MAGYALMGAGKCETLKAIEINASVEFQTIDNFGASDCWSMQKIGSWSDSQKVKIADLLFSTTQGIGLSAWRFNIGGGINTSTISHPWRTVETFEISEGVYDWSRQANERWFLNAARQRNVTCFIAFVNSPPGRMTRNGFTNCTNGLGSTNLREDYEGQYARYLTDILAHFRDDEELEFDYVSPVNEPHWEWNGSSNQEGNRASNEDIKKIVDSLYLELNNRGLTTQILLSETGDLFTNYQYNTSMENEYGEPYGNYFSEFFADTNVNSKISSHICSHSYWSDLVNNELIEHRQQLKFRILPYFINGYDYWATEYSILEGSGGNGGHGRDLSINTALDVARVIHYDLTLLDASAWQWWTAVSPEDFKDGLIYTDYFNPGDPETIIPSKTLWAFGNFSRFIRPGAKRIQLTGANNKFGLMGSAYKDENENKILIVFVNIGNTPEIVSLNISGLDSTVRVNTFTPYVTSNLQDDNLKKYPAFATVNTYEVPARSVVTLVGELEAVSGTESRKSRLPHQHQLYQNYPNPFNSSTNIPFSLSKGSYITLNIYDIQGNLVRTLLNRQKLNAGIYKTDWDGKNRFGEPVASGIYIYSLIERGFSTSKKTILLR